MHMVTDGLCSFLIFSRLYTENPELVAITFIGYNTLAFVTQSPVGAIIDKYNKPKLFLSISVALMLLGYLFGGVCILAVLFIGIGNSLFHVAGGKYVTDKSGNDIAHLGIFVSTGAFGLCLGQIYCNLAFLPYIFFALLIGSFVLILILPDAETKSYPEHFSPAGCERYAMLAVMAVVLIRSFVGKTVTADYEQTELLLIIVALATTLGKAMGGIVSKLIGMRLTTLISMSVAAICLTLGTSTPYAYILGVLAFNFSMPITLYLANVILKGREGFAFGTLAAILTPGYFIAMSFTYSLAMRIATAFMCLLTVIIIFIASKRIKNADKALIDNNIS